MLHEKVPEFSTPDVAKLVEPDRVRKEVYADPDIFQLEMERIHERVSKGIASFYRRLQRAAKEACDYGTIPGYYDKECAADALDRAVAGRGVRALERLHAQKRGGVARSRDPVVVRYVCGSDRPLGIC